MKKLIASILVFVVASALFACPGDSKAKDKDKTKGETSQVK